MNYEKCAECRCKDVEFVPSTRESFAMARCRQCKCAVPSHCRVDFNFHDLPLEMVGRIDFLSRNTFWTWGRGGVPLSDYEYSIGYLAGQNGDGPECRFKFPDAISQMLKREHECGGDEARGEMRHALRVAKGF